MQPGPSLTGTTDHFVLPPQPNAAHQLPGDGLVRQALNRRERHETAIKAYEARVREITDELEERVGQAHRQAARRSMGTALCCEWLRHTR